MSTVTNQPTTEAPKPEIENLTSQIKHKVEKLGGKIQGLGQAAVDGINGKKDKTEPPTAGERIDATNQAVAAKTAEAEAAVKDQVKDNVVDPAAEALKAASEALAPAEKI